MAKRSKAQAAPAHAYNRVQTEKWYREMYLIRRFEEQAGQLYMEQKIRGFCHLYIGQEAVAAGLEAAIRPTDTVITAYRDHGLGLVRGISANACMAELYGKITGCSKGKGGSMHYFSREHNFAGGHGIVGGQIPLGAGLAFAMKYNDTRDIAVCLMGDGAIRQGAFHEALNMAMTWKLPVLYIIENNNYAMGTSVERTSNVTDLYKLGSAFDMPSVPMDGMDVFTVYEELQPLVEHVRSGKGPVLVEMKTYRYRGHSMSDPQKYRTREELEYYKGRDPIANLKLYMLEQNLASETEIDAIEEEINEVVAESIRFAEESPFPQPSDLYQDVYVGEYPYMMDF